MTLLNSSPEKINEILTGMAADSEAIIKEAAEICWFMRGSITWEEAMGLTHKEKTVISKVIRDNIERSEKSGVPIF